MKSLKATKDWMKNRETQSLGVLIFLFFLTMSVFWVLKPIRKSLFIGYFKENPYTIFDLSLGGAQVEQLAKLSMVGIAIIVALALRRSMRVYSIRQVLVIVSVIGASGFAASFFLFGQSNAAFIWGFYVFGDFINSLILTSLWMLIHDAVNTSQAKKIYSAIGVGIVAGGVFGSFFLYQAIGILGREYIVALCILPIIAIGVFASYYTFRFGDSSGSTSDRATQAMQNKINKKETWNPFGFWKSGDDDKRRFKYWMAIALLVCLYEISSGIIDFQLSVAVENIQTTGIEMDRYFGLIGQVQSMLALIIQVFVTRWLMKRWGLGVALLILPFAILFGSVGFLLIPTLASAMVLSVSDNALNYSVNQSAKETLYVPTRSEERITAKPLIDLFVQRFSKTFAIILNLILVTQVSLENVRWLSLLAISLMISWIFIARFTSREFEHLTVKES